MIHWSRLPWVMAFVSLKIFPYCSAHTVLHRLMHCISSRDMNRDTLVSQHWRFDKNRSRLIKKCRQAKSEPSYALKKNVEYFLTKPVGGSSLKERPRHKQRTIVHTFKIFCQCCRHLDFYRKRMGVTGR